MEASSLFLNPKDIPFLLILLVVVAGWLLIRGIEWFCPWLATRMPARWRFYILPVVPVSRLLLLGLSLAIILPWVLNPKVNVVVLLGGLGVALGFAFKDYVSCLVAGIVAIYERPYRVGDWVAINGAYGEVRAIDSRSLQLVTPDDTVVTVPHQKIFDTNIFNANDGERTLQCAADFFLHPQHDAALARQKLYDVALTSALVLLEKPIVVTVKEEPWGTHYRLKAYPIEGRDQFQFTSDLTVRGKAALARLGVPPVVAPVTAR